MAQLFRSPNSLFHQNSRSLCEHITVQQVCIKFFFYKKIHLFYFILETDINLMWHLDTCLIHRKRDSQKEREFFLVKQKIRTFFFVVFNPHDKCLSCMHSFSSFAKKPSLGLAFQNFKPFSHALIWLIWMQHLGSEHLFS